jgi:hypothetical protein
MHPIVPVIFVLGIGLAVFLIYRDARAPVEAKLAAPTPSAPSAPSAQVVNTPEPAPKTPVVNSVAPPTRVLPSPRPTVETSFPTASPGPGSQQPALATGDDALLRPYTGPILVDPRLRRDMMPSRSDPRMRRVFDEPPRGNGR